MSILAEFWYGNLYPNEQAIKKGSEYFRALNKLTDKHNEIFADVSPEQRAWAEHLLSLQSDVNSIAEKDAFVLGFRLGVQMMVESLTDLSV